MLYSHVTEWVTVALHSTSVILILSHSTFEYINTISMLGGGGGVGACYTALVSCMTLDSVYKRFTWVHKLHSASYPTLGGSQSFSWGPLTLCNNVSSYYVIYYLYCLDKSIHCTCMTLDSVLLCTRGSHGFTSYLLTSHPTLGEPQSFSWGPLTVTLCNNVPCCYFIHYLYCLHVLA